MTPLFMGRECPHCAGKNTLALDMTIQKRPVRGAFPSRFQSGPLLHCTRCQWNAVGVPGHDDEGRRLFTFDFQPTNEPGGDRWLS